MLIIFKMTGTSTYCQNGIQSAHRMVKSSLENVAKVKVITDVLHADSLPCTAKLNTNTNPKPTIWQYGWPLYLYRLTRVRKHLFSACYLCSLLKSAIQLVNSVVWLAHEWHGPPETISMLKIHCEILFQFTELASWSYQYKRKQQQVSV